MGPWDNNYKSNNYINRIIIEVVGLPIYFELIEAHEWCASGGLQSARSFFLVGNDADVAGCPSGWVCRQVFALPQDLVTTPCSCESSPYSLLSYPKALQSLFIMIWVLLQQTQALPHAGPSGRAWDHRYLRSLNCVGCKEAALTLSTGFWKSGSRVYFNSKLKC